MCLLIQLNQHSAMLNSRPIHFEFVLPKTWTISCCRPILLLFVVITSECRNLIFIVIDINECVEMSPSPCRGGSCINTPGSFRCECPKGLKATNGAASCEGV